jgi:hypothetical protein
MVPEEYREFFVASAGASGALIGLLFVAVSVFPERARQATTRVEFQTRSSAALVVFTSALIVSLAALVPGVSLGWWAIASATVVLTFALATIRPAAADFRRRSANRRWTWLVVGLLVIGGWEAYAGVRLVRTGDTGALQTLTYVVIADLAFGIARAWQLVGLRDTGVLTSLRILAGRDDALPPVDVDRPSATT